MLKIGKRKKNKRRRGEDLSSLTWWKSPSFHISVYLANVNDLYPCTYLRMKHWKEANVKRIIYSSKLKFFFHDTSSRRWRLPPLTCVLSKKYYVNCCCLPMMLFKKWGTVSFFWESSHIHIFAENCLLVLHHPTFGISDCEYDGSDLCSTWYFKVVSRQGSGGLNCPKYCAK